MAGKEPTAPFSEPPPDAGWHLIIIEGLPFAARLLSAAPCLIGRAIEADWRLDIPEISRRHCSVQIVAGGVQVQDLGSRRGTHVNDQMIAASTLLRAGDRVRLGPITLRVGQGAPPSEASEEAAFDVRATMRFRGQPVLSIPLAAGLTLGREGADVLLDHPTVSRQHAQLKAVRNGLAIMDLRSRAGSFANGHPFDEHLLTIGDRVQIGVFHFRFDGVRLNRVSANAGGEVSAAQLVRRVCDHVLLSEISLRIPAGRFVGILGPSGAGKSTLLHALSGLHPADSGRALVGGFEVVKGPPPELGFVPQEDIVHAELTVAQALGYSAQLRLPRDTPLLERQKLILQTMRRLGLAERATTRIRDLSGGQRKRVSVAVELLSSPSVLFLDEPTSGLDPATEFKMMELLRDLADGGCTIVCTTHVVENIYLMDQLLLLAAGKMVFDGTPQEVREHFGIVRFAALYERLERLEQPSEPPRPPDLPVPPRTFQSEPARRAWSLPVLWKRQAAILIADWRNLALLGSQPLWIAALICWVSRDASMLLFWGMLATLWFGCSNAAQEIVRELPIYRRERLIGVTLAAYLASKFTFLAAITLAQSVLLLAALQVFHGGLPGTSGWQMAALLGTALAASAIGCAISAWARNSLQAALAVPLLLIPLIVLSGFVVPASEMRAEVRAVAALTPSYAAQRMMDLSLLWHEKIEREILADHWSAVRNVKTEVEVRNGTVFQDAGPGTRAALTLLAWAVLGVGAAAAGIRQRERVG